MYPRDPILKEARASAAPGLPLPGAAGRVSQAGKFTADLVTWGRGGRRQQAWAYLVLPGVFLAATALYPAVQLVRLSVSNVGPENLIGKWPWLGLGNFQAVVGSSAFRSALWLSAIFTLVLLATNLVVGFIAALWVSQPGRLSNVTQSIMVLGWALPPIVTGSAWKFLLQDNGLINAGLHDMRVGNVPWLSSARVALWSTIAITAWAGVPFCTMVLKAGLMGVPGDIVEAAEVDGANARRVVLRVILPQMRSVIATLSVLIVVYGFGSSFSFIYVVTEGGPGTATTTLPYLGYVQAFTDFEFGVAAATAVISIIIVGLLVTAYLRAAGKEVRA